MSIQACAEILRRGDPDRFLATMAAPPDARAVLFSIYAFNLEVARAPWVTYEPLIAEMRLQFWRDVLDQIDTGRPVSDHEAAIALAQNLPHSAIPVLDKLVQARRRDISGEPFANSQEFDAYLTDTGGGLMVAVGTALGENADHRLTSIGRISGLANWCLAAAELQARGRAPFVDASPKAIAQLANEALAALAVTQTGAPLSRATRIAALSGWRTRAILKSVARHPERVLSGASLQSEFGRRGGLMLRSLGLR